MLFNSVEFLIFFPIVAAIYFLAPYRFRWILLLAASYYFYMSWKPEYVILIIISTLIDYICAIQIKKSDSQIRRRAFLVLSLLSNLGLLFAFKYFNFFNESVRAIFNQFNIFYDIPAFQVLLPVGISFYTFQTLSYTIDVYNGKRDPESHLGIFALYVSFFPQLVAGPIERASRLLPQFRQQKNFEYERVISGLRLMAWGFFKKLVIADRIAFVVNAIYNDPTEFTGLPLIIATYFFAFQIYCDFSGYSDIAIGAARVLGFDLMENFKRPYFSRSISEFWHRWHISLSTWFRDYLYIPLGGSRVIKIRWYFNLMTVFLISGLWHGANWTFVIWGALHGLFLLVGIWTTGLRNKLESFVEQLGLQVQFRWLQVIITFNLVSFAWIFFRANSISDALYIATHIFINSNTPIDPSQIGFDWYQVGVAVIAIILMEMVHLIQENGLSLTYMVNSKPLVVRWVVYYGLVFSIILFGEFSVTEFIYFQF